MRECCFLVLSKEIYRSPSHTRAILQLIRNFSFVFLGISSHSGKGLLAQITRTANGRSTWADGWWSCVYHVWYWWSWPCLCTRNRSVRTISLFTLSIPGTGHYLEGEGAAAKLGITCSPFSDPNFSWCTFFPNPLSPWLNESLRIHTFSCVTPLFALVTLHPL